MARQVAIPCPDCGRRFGGQTAFDRHRVIAGDLRRCRREDELRERGMWRDDWAVWHRPPVPGQPSLLQPSESVGDTPADKLARRSDPVTSHLAARQLSGKAGTMRRRLLEAYAYPDAQRVGLTANGAAFVAGYSAAEGAWKRVSDLLKAGLLFDTGTTRIGASGRQQRVLRITAAGLAACRAEEARTA